MPSAPNHPRTMNKTHQRTRWSRCTSGVGGQRSQGGFTLLEVLLAFVVFALSFAVVLEILSGSMRNTVRAREYTEVALIAQSVMDQVGFDIPLQSGSSAAGEIGEFRWEVQIYPFVGSNLNTRSLELGDITGIELLEVEFVIFWGEYPREKDSRFTTVKAVLVDRELRI